MLWKAFTCCNLTAPAAGTGAKGAQCRRSEEGAMQHLGAARGTSKLEAREGVTNPSRAKEKHQAAQLAAWGRGAVTEEMQGPGESRQGSPFLLTRQLIYTLARRGPARPMSSRDVSSGAWSPSSAVASAKGRSSTGQHSRATCSVWVSVQQASILTRVGEKTKWQKELGR